MGLSLLEAPEEPVASLDEARIQTRSENPEEDSLLEDLVAAATAQAEAYCRRKFVTQQWRQTFDRFPTCGTTAAALRRAVVLDYPALVSVESVKYIDADGTLQTVSPADYVVRPNETPGEIVPAYGVSWPSPRDEPDAVRVEFTCGFGAAADVPAPVRRAVLVTVAHLYGYRESTELPQAAKWLLDPYRVLRFAA